MGTTEIILGIILLVVAVALTVLVLFQSGKDKRLSGTIAGAAESFFGAGKSKTRDKVLSRITTVLSFVFCVLAIVTYIYVFKLHG